MDNLVPPWGELTLGAVALLSMAWIVVKLIDVWAKRAPGIPPEIVQVIKENSEVNARLVVSVEGLVKSVQSVQEGQNGLLLAITKLIAKIEGSVE